MLKKRDRLSSKEFNRFFSSGLRSHSFGLQLVYTPHPTFHAAIIVPKKIEKLAVKRNKLRRRIYDIMRRYVRMEDSGGIYIIVVKPKAKEYSYTKLKEEIIQLTNQAHL